MSTQTNISNCEICGDKSWLVEDTRYDSTEEHCLNDKCRFYHVDSGTLKYENPDSSGVNPHAFDGNGVHTLEGWKHTLECFGFKQYEKCGHVDQDNEDDSVICEDCESIMEESDE